MQEARGLLKALNFDGEWGKRSALVLHALLGLLPDEPWSQAANPTPRTVELLPQRCRHEHQEHLIDIPGQLHAYAAAPAEAALREVSDERRTPPEWPSAVAAERERSCPP